MPVQELLLQTTTRPRSPLAQYQNASAGRLRLQHTIFNTIPPSRTLLCSCKSPLETLAWNMYAPYHRSPPVTCLHRYLRNPSLSQVSLISKSPLKKLFPQQVYRCHRSPLKIVSCHRYARCHRSPLKPCCAAGPPDVTDQLWKP